MRQDPTVDAVEEVFGASRRREATPAHVLAWLQGHEADPWGGSSGGGDAILLEAATYDITDAEIERDNPGYGRMLTRRRHPVGIPEMDRAPLGVSNPYDGDVERP